MITSTGDIEDFPGLDGLPCYNVAVSPNGDVKVSGSKSLLAANKRVKCMAKKKNSEETIVIIGGGLFSIVSFENKEAPKTYSYHF